MILKYKLEGYWALQSRIILTSILAPIVIVPASVMGEVSICTNSILNIVFLAIGAHIFGVLSFWAIFSVQFKGRNDPYIFQSYYPLTMPGMSLGQVEDLLLNDGYVKSSDEFIFQKEIRVETGIGTKIVEQHRWQVKIESKGNDVAMTFFLPNQPGFDGRQIAYRAAMDFRNKFSNEKK